MARTSHALAVGRTRLALRRGRRPGARRRAFASSASRPAWCSCSTGTAGTAPPVAQRLGVPHHVVPRTLPETPFELRPVVRLRWWREVALWWPERRILARRGRARHDPVLPRGRRAGRPAPVPPAQAAALADGSRRPTTCSSATAKASTAATRPHSSSALRTARRRIPALAGGDTAHRPQGVLASAGEQAGPDEPRRRLQARLAHRRVERLGERRGRERGGAALGGRVGVERRPLARHAAVRADQRLHRLRRHLLAVLGAGRARDRLVHQRPAEVVHARRGARRRRPRARASPTRPGCS